MMKVVAMLCLGFLSVAQLPPIGRVDSTFDKGTKFSALRTYTWTTGAHAFNPAAHKLIVEAIEAEMAGLGFTKAASGADVTLAYYTTTVANVDFKALDKTEARGVSAPTTTLGKLVVIMRNASARQIWSAGTREYLDSDIEKLGGVIRPATRHLFETYPRR
jgi:hypothetical protein